MKYDEMCATLEKYDWDDGFALPRKLLDEPACDLALALKIFYTADGYTLLSGGWKDSGLPRWKEFIHRLYEEIRQGRYPQTDNAFSVPLNRVQQCQLRKSGVPEVFLTDLPVLSDSLRQAIDDTRRRENLYGPFDTAEQAVASMLEGTEDMEQQEEQT